MASADDILTDLLRTAPPRAGSCIVTVYGDVAVPRGGSLWMGNLIEICAELGLSESLVRTAVSRLVSGGQLEGKRLGRRSYYQLTPSAQIEFTRASQLIFSPVTSPRHWLWLVAPRETGIAAPAGFAEVSSGLWLGPDRGQEVPAAASAMRAVTLNAGASLTHFVAKHWEIAAQQAAYAAFLARFEPLSEAALDDLKPERALVARLALIHDYRTCLLADPRLPRDGLPEDWAGDTAQQLFATLYARLSPLAERHVADRFETEAGKLPQETPESRARLAALVSGPE